MHACLPANILPNMMTVNSSSETASQETISCISCFGLNTAGENNEGNIRTVVAVEIKDTDR